MTAPSAKPRGHPRRKRHRTPGRLNLIFDADDTLWHSNIHFVEAERVFVAAAIEAGVDAGAVEIAAAVRRAELFFLTIRRQGSSTLLPSPARVRSVLGLV